MQGPCATLRTASVRTKPWKNTSCPATVHVANSWFSLHFSTTSFKSKDKAENKWASQLSRSLADREMIHVTDFSPGYWFQFLQAHPTLHFSLWALHPQDFQEYLNVTESVFMYTYKQTTNRSCLILLTLTEHLVQCHIYKLHTDSVPTKNISESFRRPRITLNWTVSAGWQYSRFIYVLQRIYTFPQMPKYIMGIEPMTLALQAILNKRDIFFSSLVFDSQDWSGVVFEKLFSSWETSATDLLQYAKKKKTDICLCLFSLWLL